MSKDDSAFRELAKLLIEERAMPRVTIRTDDLWMLVDFAVKHEEITLSRAAELTGVPLSVWRAKYNTELTADNTLVDYVNDCMETE